jgi:hypothetical protein
MNRTRPPKSRSAALVLILLCAAFTAFSCGGSVASTQEPRSSAGFDNSPPPSTPEEAIEQFDHAALQVDQSLMAMTAYAEPPAGVTQPPGQYPGQYAQPSPQAAPSTPPPPPAPPSPGVADSAPKEAKAEIEANRAAPTMSGDPCETACRALASMGRAAEHLCGLAGAEDPRCNNAKERFRAAEGRVKQSCPRCAG